MGKFATVVIDPPWDVALGPVFAVNPGGGLFAPDLTYKRLSLEELAALPVGETLADDGLLFCWTIEQFLYDTPALLEAWGCPKWFTMTWHKTNGPQFPGKPKYTGEWCLVGRRGRPAFTNTKAFSTVNTWPVTGHSRKPEGFYDLLRRVTPGPRLDIFGRRRIAGFESWGNEAPEGVALPDHYQQVLLEA